MRASILTACCYVAGTLFLVGCDSGGGYKPVDTKKNKTDDSIATHEHEHGPHGGPIIELGKEEYHGELVLDEKTKVLGLFLYGPDVKTPTPIDAKKVTVSLKVDGKTQQLELPAKPQQGESGGKSSHFELAVPADIAKNLHDAEDLEGQLQLVVGDKPYTGTFEPHHHDHADHKEGDKEKADK